MNVRDALNILNKTFEMKYGTVIDRMYGDIMELAEPHLKEADNPDLVMSAFIKLVTDKIGYDIFTLYKRRWSE